jgi:predicted secreted Zn-dependent protease
VRFIFAGLAFIATVAHLPSVPLEQEVCDVAVRTEYYDVEGVTPEVIRASMLERGPRDAGGAPRFAFTEWSVAWRWGQDSHGRVKADSLQVQCDARMMVPRLRNEQQIDSEVLRLWGDFQARLYRHELNHLIHVRRVAPRIRRRIAAAERVAGEPLSPYRANRIAARVVGEIRALDRAYDSRTNHGKSEGIWSFGNALGNYSPKKRIPD